MNDIVEQFARSMENCPICEGDGNVADGLDEAACSIECPRCFGSGLNLLLSFNKLLVTPALNSLTLSDEVLDEGADAYHTAVEAAKQNRRKRLTAYVAAGWITQSQMDQRCDAEFPNDWLAPVFQAMLDQLIKEGLCKVSTPNSLPPASE